MNSKICLIVAVFALGACATAPRTAVLSPDSTLLGGELTTVKIEVPTGWYTSVSRGDRQEFVAPDNFARIYLSAVPVQVDAERCAALAQRAAQSEAGKQSRGQTVKVELAAAEGAPEVVDYSMAVRGSPPGPTDRVVMGRAVCRDGALAVVTCSIGVEQREQMGETCERVLSSLILEPQALAAVEAPAEEPVVPAEEPAAPAEQPAAPAEQPAAPAEQPAAPVPPAPETPAATP